MMRRSLQFICALLAANCMIPISATFRGSYHPANSSSLCRNLPGDHLWPSARTWTDLNTTVNGRLVRTTPLGTPCHDPTYDESECAALKQVWVYPQTYFNSSSGFVAPIFQNQSCDPFTPQKTPCLLGNDVAYAINVSSARDAAMGLRFAEKNNIRIVIKSTGQDLLGRSTGKGALSIWTHYLKDISIYQYESANYSGPAIKLGAGVQVWEALEAANARKLRVLGGTGPTVGLAGAFSQGGGHSDLSSVYGLAADQVLEWEVVTANGDHLTASPAANFDIYWALSGGGGSTYGLVISMTVKAFPDGPIGTAAITFSAFNASQNTYWKGVSAFHSNLLTWVERGGSASYSITNQSFSLIPATFPDTSKNDVTRLISPLQDTLDGLGLHYSINVTTFPSYLTYVSHYFGPLPYGPYAAAQVQGGRLIPRSVVQTKNEDLSNALREITRGGEFYIIGRGLNVSHSVAGNSPASNAILPSWRESVATLITASIWDYTLPLEENVMKEDRVTNSITPLLQSVTGDGAGVYMNEGDYRQPDFQTQFYGSNYPALKSIKKKYDPHDLFYATTAVGSEAWAVASDGRLCRSIAS